MIEHAFLSQARMADIIGVDPQPCSIWLGVDKPFQNPRHYAERAKPHGEHTLIKGQALRLEHVAAHVTTPGIILMESDATPAEALPRVLAALVQLLKQETFCLACFCHQREAKHVQIARVRGRQ